MTDQLYFQWQNDVLRTSIYPLREMKLRDFLVFFREIDLWAEYKKKNLADEVDQYHTKKKQAIDKAVKAYYDFRIYFMKEDVRTTYMEKFKAVDEEALKDIHAFHKTFAVYLPRITDPRKETYFVSQQVLYWQQYRKDYLKKITAKAYKIDIMKRQVPPNPNVPNEEKLLKNMQELAFKMVDDELERLYDFVSASSKIEKRKTDIHRATQEALKNVDALTPQLQKIQSQIDAQEMLQKKALDELARLKSPPTLAPIESYFSTLDVSAQIRAKYPQASQSLIESINGFHKDLKDQLGWSKTDDAKLGVIKNALNELGQFQRKIKNEIAKHETDLRNMGPAWRYKAEREALRDNLINVSMKAITEELNKLTDYQSGFEFGRKPQNEMARLIQTKEQELAKINGTISQLEKEAQAVRVKVDAYDDILNVTEERQLSLYVPDPTKPVTMNEIVLLKIEEFKEELENKEHYELLELVVKEFKEKPNRYPKWLQYMVVHFSGMRYASAHGSWADPKDLLANLEASFIGKELKKRDASFVEAACREKLECYAPSQAAGTTPLQPKPAFAQATDPDSLKSIADHVARLKRGLETGSTSLQRSALLNLRIEEENYRIDRLKPPEILDGLLSHKNDIPDWMWKEVVKLTDLRVNLVKDKNWEKLTPAEQAKQYSFQDTEFRTMMENWKQKFLTSWREEHDQSDKLIVTRAVCNEVAEHIQHLRGHSPWGGLTAKPKWYKSQKAQYPASFFELPSKAEDFKTGASLLWLRFVYKEPSEWQIAHPIPTDSGKELIPQKYLTGKRQPAPNGTTPWVYDRSDPIKRSRNLVNEKGIKLHQDEWLRWIHEATVVETAETANGWVVLTFETALPSDDPRLSTIGVFKRYVDDLTWDLGEDTFNPAFVGYVPEGQVPVEHLKDMLDWEKILLKPSQ
jgi:hypothetical protein